MRHGADGDTLELAVPPGTEVVIEADGTRHDLVHPGQRALVARGGAGGRGNKRFAGPTHQTPRFSERGLPGDETWLTLRLKLLADVGLVGLPNAGKSSLLSRLTRAHPKIAGYPFTTTEPVLGTLELAERQVILADIPGLIEGASAGSGLGHEFLAHVERTKLLVHVVDVAPVDGSDPETNFDTVERELALHDPRLARLPRVLALSKVDLIEPTLRGTAKTSWEGRMSETPVVLTSAATGAGIEELKATLAHRLPEPDEEPPTRAQAQTTATDPDSLAEHRVFRPAADRAYHVRRTGEHRYSVSGKGIERLLARYDLENEEALAHLERRLRGIGVIGALESAGFQPGDEVDIAGTTFDLDPER
jgi:GTP-binding protein